MTDPVPQQNSIIAGLTTTCFCCISKLQIRNRPRYFAQGNSQISKTQLRWYSAIRILHTENTLRAYWVLPEIHNYVHKNAVTVSTELTSNHCLLRATPQRPGLLMKHQLPPMQGGFCRAKASAESVLQPSSKQLTLFPGERQFNITRHDYKSASSVFPILFNPHPCCQQNVSKFNSFQKPVISAWHLRQHKDKEQALQSGPPSL